MKKFLFTLATLVAFGFAANAAEAVFGFSQAEVTMHKGETVELQIMLQSTDVQVKGFQMDWEMYDPSGAIMPDGCVLQFLQKYGTRARYQYFGKTGVTVDNETSFSTSNGVASTQADILGNNTGHYTLIAANTSAGVCYYEDEACPTPIANFTVEAQDSWDKPYAILTMTKCGLVYPAADGGEVVGQFFNLKIINADYEEPGEEKLDCDSPSIQRINNNDGTYTIQIMAGYTEDLAQQTDGELKYTVDVEPLVATFNAELNAWELDYAAGTEDVTVHVVAWTEASETFNASTEAEDDIVIPKLPQVATPTMSYTYDNEEGTITVTATTTTEGATCYVVGPDNEAHVAPYTFSYDIYEGYDANWTAYATAPNMTQSETCDPYNVVVAEVEKVYQTNDPEINAVPDNAREVVVITVTGEGNIVVTVTGVNGVIATAEGTEPVVVEVPFLPVGSEPEFVSVKAVATADLPEGYDRVLPATVTEPVEIPAKQEVVLEDLTGELVFSAVDQTNGTFTVTYEGPEEDVVVTIVNYQERGANGQLPEQGKYYNVTAKASKAGYNDLTDNDELIWLYKPVIDVNVETVQQWIGPEDNAVLTTGQIVTLEGIENDNPDGVIMYSIDGGIAKVWTGEAVEVTGNGDHVIEAWVVANGDVESEHATETIHIDNDFTAVNEIANGKAVAGVRYFNLAGQEMTEANGVTIVVTTYTDGTTSAVKVMK